MTLLKKNIAANFVGNIWQALMGLAFIPLYINFMGVESYGLVGIFATLQAIFALLDMGLSTTLNREMARLSALPDKEQEMRNLVRSLEIIYWSIALFIGIVVIMAAPYIANKWIKTVQLSPQTIEQALRIMGCAMALQWPASLYYGGIAGLQKQVLLNVINSSMSTLRSVGVVLILWLVSPTVLAFFLWQIIISFINTALLALFLWHSLRLAGNKAIFQKKLLVAVWRFAAGVSGISILATILTQLDKIILSKMLSLEMFGYYSLSGAVAITLYRLIGPVFIATYPRLTELVFFEDQDGLKQLYHKSCQVMSVLILPVTVIVALFSYEILLIWTQNPVTAERCHLLVSILICGTALNGLMNIPYALQLANGWTSLTLAINLIAIIILVPTIVFVTREYGALGGASVWILLNGCYVFIGIHLMHRRLLPDEKWRWYWQDVFLPFFAAIVPAGFGKLLFISQASGYGMIPYLLIVSALTLFITALFTPTSRVCFLNQLSRFKFGNR
jgi:O-antigen/teichoic acid export membrane protein